MELKARHVVDVYDNYSEHPCKESSQVYLKSEADKVIAEKDTKIIQLEALIENYNRISGEIIDNANHQKYRRCLAMARWCEVELEKLDYKAAIDYTNKDVWRIATSYFTIWRRRWLKLAEIFKEAGK